MKFARRTRILTQRPDVIPIVNVALLLLLFFIVAMRFVQDPGVSIQIPEAAALPISSASPYPPLIVTITGENPETRAAAIFCNDELVDMRKLGRMLADSKQQTPYRECVVKADRLAPHGTVVAVLSLAQQAGFKTVRLATQAPPNLPSLRAP